MIVEQERHSITPDDADASIVPTAIDLAREYAIGVPVAALLLARFSTNLERLRVEAGEFAKL